ncbi:deoxyguanosinetriphosphate triphosphohydrolase [Aggregatilineales bacterium SYSU G02658]
MMRHREQLEALEAQALAPYAVSSRASRGRFHPDHEPAYRTAFQRDHDRIVHSAAFRRLEYKTQVFVNDEGDYYRTRLTHTLEVAQIGRTIARALGVNVDLTETICLAHDLGHPPFGHSGEQVLDELMRDHGGFNHNHQSYRVVTELETRYPRWRGLNLTYETLEGIAKHETDTVLPTQEAFDLSLRPSLEAQIANFADELAYNAHDLDDGLQANLLTLAQLRDLEIWRWLEERLGVPEDGLTELNRHRFIRELVGVMVDDVLQTTQQALDELAPKSLIDIQRHTANIVAFSPRMQRLTRQLRSFLYDNMYYHFRVVKMKSRAHIFIGRLFKAYIQEPRNLPPEYRSKIEENGLHRCVADYIACMTDRSALLEYRQLYDAAARP